MEYKHLTKWINTSNYMGEGFSNYYIVLSRHRDSGSLKESNFEQALKKLGGESDTVIVIHSTHWAVGWIDQLAIYELDSDKLFIGEQILEDLSNYPVLNEEDYSQRQWNKAEKFYNNLSSRNKWEYYLSQEKISMFASRYDLKTLCEKYPYTRVYEYLTADD